MSHSLADFQDLTPVQRLLLERLEQEKRFTDTFYFTGGTLLKALGIVPRESNDLDFFTFPDVDGRTYIQRLQDARVVLQEVCGGKNVLDTERGWLLTDENTRVECIYDTVKNISEFVSFGALQTSGFPDLAANKAAAFCVRDEMKDYVDLAFLTKQEGWSLKDLADIAEKRFHLGTLREEKLLTEFIAKRDMFTVDPHMFLRNGAENARLVEEQVRSLLQHTTL